MLFQCAGQPLRSLPFLNRNLRSRMNPAAEITQFARRGVNCLQDSLAHLFQPPSLSTGASHPAIAWPPRATSTVQRSDVGIGVVPAELHSRAGADGKSLGPKAGCCRG